MSGNGYKCFEKAVSLGHVKAREKLSTMASGSSQAPATVPLSMTPDVVGDAPVLPAVSRLQAPVASLPIVEPASLPKDDFARGLLYLEGSEEVKQNYELAARYLIAALTGDSKDAAEVLLRENTKADVCHETRLIIDAALAKVSKDIPVVAGSIAQASLRPVLGLYHSASASGGAAEPEPLDVALFTVKP